jgi:hypothetical protein
MRWLRWLVWWHRPAPDGHAAAKAEREATMKLGEVRPLQAEARQVKDSFTAQVEAAMARRRHQ